MISNNDASRRYKLTTEITSTRKTKQVVMLYDGVIKYLSTASAAIERGDVQTRYNNTELAGKIIDGLHSCLDPEKGMGITEILDQFYSGIFIRIMNLNFEKNKETNLKNCDQIIKEIRIMREAWAEVDSKIAMGDMKIESNTSDNDSKSTSGDQKPDSSLEISA